MRWGSPTATPPFATLGFAHSLKSTSRMRSSIFGIYHSGGVFHPSATYIGQFGKLTDRIEREPRSLSLTASSASPLTVPKEPRSLSLPKGPFPNSIFIPSLTHPALKAVFCFRGSASVFSVKFRVNPWLIFSLLLPLLSVYSVLKPSRWGWVN